jgi:IS30 family transposase
MSGKTIYNHVRFHLEGELKKPALEDLRQRGKRRKRGGKIPAMTLIDTRPAEINARTVWVGIYAAGTSS